MPTYVRRVVVDTIAAAVALFLAHLVVIGIAVSGWARAGVDLATWLGVVVALFAAVCLTGWALGRIDRLGRKE